MQEELEQIIFVTWLLVTKYLQIQLGLDTKLVYPLSLMRPLCLNDSNVRYKDWTKSVRQQPISKEKLCFLCSYLWLQSYSSHIYNSKSALFLIRTHTLHSSILATVIMSLSLVSVHESPTQCPEQQLLFCNSARYVVQ